MTDTTKTALVLIDLMPRIVALPTGPYDGTAVLARCVELADATRAAGGLIVWVRVERPGVDVQPEGSELAVEPAEGDLVIVKRTLGAFHHTGLDEALRERGIETVVLAGIATNFGVESTGRIADEHDYAVVFVADAMTGLDAHAHEFAVDYMFPKLGTVTTTAAYLENL
ncbi:isochorismatase family protein [Kribbella deserti]|uniref:Isochorismatase family protein n=1 Tax=Kribbella deserti TaxID=1926257 RepID=A0ABV6QJ20_9ACTN